ncbi:MAG: biotin transporter BioY, partial [Acidimicrobiia bacterium]
MQTTLPSRVITGAVLPRTTVITAASIVGFALLTAAAAQVRIQLPFTPVPITGQTFAVLLSGAALGAVAGGASQLLYLGLGAVGLPFYAGGEAGWDVVSGATGGYLLGFVAAAIVVGMLAERRQDRTVWSAMPAFLLGSVVIYFIGVPWLYASVDAITTGEQAVATGFTPFIIGDLIKIGLAGLL